MHRSYDDEHGEPATVRLSAFGSLEGTELAGLIQIAGPERMLGRGDILWREHTRLPSLFVLLDGWMISRMSIDGGRGLTLKVHLPGDGLGMPSLAYATSAETMVALTPVKLRPLELHSIGHLFEAHPRVAAMMFLVSQQERMELLDRLASVHTANVTQRLAAFVCRLLERVRRSFPGTGDSFFMPATRQDVADIIGTGLPQLAEALRQLRAENILGWTDRLLTIVDPAALTAKAKLPARQLAQNSHWFPAIGNEG